MFARDLNWSTNDGSTPLDWADQKGDSTAAHLFKACNASRPLRPWQLHELEELVYAAQSPEARARTVEAAKVAGIDFTAIVSSMLAPSRGSVNESSMVDERRLLIAFQAACSKGVTGPWLVKTAGGVKVKNVDETLVEVYTPADLSADSSWESSANETFKCRGRDRSDHDAWVLERDPPLLGEGPHLMYYDNERASAALEETKSGLSRFIQKRAASLAAAPLSADAEALDVTQELVEVAITAGIAVQQPREQLRDVIANRKSAKELIACHINFVDAGKIRSCTLTSLPSLQQLRVKYSSWLHIRHISFEAVCRGEYREEYLSVSHRWEDPHSPDPSGAQFKEIKSYLKENLKIKFVFFDWCSLPQGERTAGEQYEFRATLPNINMLYLGTQVLILLDRSYLSRFWTQVIPRTLNCHALGSRPPRGCGSLKDGWPYRRQRAKALLVQGSASSA